MMRKPEEAEAQGLVANEKTLEAFHEEYLKNDLPADYEMVGIENDDFGICHTISLLAGKRPPPVGD